MCFSACWDSKLVPDIYSTAGASSCENVYEKTFGLEVNVV